MNENSVHKNPYITVMFADVAYKLVRILCHWDFIQNDKYAHFPFSFFFRFAKKGGS